MSRSRRALRFVAVVLAGGAAVTAAGVAGADQSTTVYVSDVGGNCFTVVAGNPPCGARPSVEVETGDTVTWDFTGSVQMHNVANGDKPFGDPEFWASSFDTKGTYSRVYGTAGTYRFICQAHTGMEGTVIVKGAPVATPTATPTPIPTATPTATATAVATTAPAPTAAPDDHTTTPAPGRASVKDSQAPRLASISLKRVAAGARLRFWLSEPATVSIDARRRGRKAVLHSITVQAPAGTRALVLRSKRFKTGRYTVRLRATDAMGNTSAPASKTLKVVR